MCASIANAGGTARSACATLAHIATAENAATLKKFIAGCGGGANTGTMAFAEDLTGSRPVRNMVNTTFQVRPERPDDRAAIHALNRGAFPSPAEAALVDALRERASPFVSLVAEGDGRIIGHICFSPVSIAEAPARRLMGLAPMAVESSRRNQGVGAALVRTGLDACRALGIDAVVVLGHPTYYPRFGFRPAAEWGIGCEYEAPPEAFMALELRAGALADVSGTARYHEAFGEL